MSSLGDDSTWNKILVDFIFDCILSLNGRSKNNPFDLGNLPPISGFSQEKLFLQKMFRYGLYDQIFKISEVLDFSPQGLSFISAVILDRELDRLSSVEKAYKSSGFEEKLKDKGLEAIRFSIPSYDFTYEEGMKKLENIDFNEKYSEFINLYSYCFQNEDLRAKDFFQKRYPVPFVIKNFSYFLLKSGDSLGSLSLYFKYANELNDDVADLIFKNRLENSKSNIFDDLSVAELHKLVRLYNVKEVTNFLRKSNHRHNNLVVELFKANFELRTAREKLSSPQDLIEKPDNTAICLSGQLRGAAECFPFWSHFLGGKHQVFLSTWDDIGFPRGAEAGRLGRMLPPLISNYFSNWSVEEFEKNFPYSFEKLKPKGNAEKLINYLIHELNLENLHSVINDERDFDALINRARGEVSGVHRNQIKMFYNMYKLEKMVYDFEVKNNTRFENIVWARPDFMVTNLNLSGLDLENFVYTSRISDEGRMLDYLMIFKRDSLKYLAECYLNLISPIPSRVFGYNHGPRLITDMFLAYGYSALELDDSKLLSSGLQAWRPNHEEFFTSFYEELIPSKLTNKQEILALLKCDK